MTLREAARRTALSITTLRRYVRSGRLRADKRPGRFGPEYFLSDSDLRAAGLESRLDDGDEQASGRWSSRGPTSTGALAAERLLRDSVPVALYQELQMKHEQLLVQYGMMRAGGLRVLELRGQLDVKQEQLREAQGRTARLRDELGRQTARLQQTELELEGRGLELAALREKVRVLEMLTRNAATNRNIDEQFGEIMAQTQRVDRLHARLDKRSDNPDTPTLTGTEDREH